MWMEYGFVFYFIFMWQSFSDFVFAYGYFIRVQLLQILNIIRYIFVEYLCYNYNKLLYNIYGLGFKVIEFKVIFKDGFSQCVQYVKFNFWEFFIKMK